ncbi:MAG: metal-dependent transcriptional regulator [Planctomycetes bacterium]|nr:metal-dependent transcriptional regulator [Planctomycetota bacterium]
MRKNRPEDYLKTIYQICEQSRQAVATTSVVARRMGVSDGTASSTIRQLAGAGLVVHRPYEGAQLTEEGLRLALRVLRRQRLLESFLARTLNIPWDKVGAEAERLETSASDELIRRIDLHLGFPDSDPHGDPIPKSDGTLPAASQVVLAGCSPGTVFVIARVLDQSRETLQYLSEIGLNIGIHGKVTSNTATGGTIAVSIPGGNPILSRTVAAKILVSIESSG